MPFQPVSLKDLYGFSAESLKFILSYLKNRKQRTLTENSYSSWEEIRAGVQQGSIWLSFLFNIFIVDLFLFPKNYNIANCTDYNILYATADCFEVIIEKLSADLISNRNYENYMILNPKKCYYICQGKNFETIWHFSFQETATKNTDTHKLLGIIIDHKLNFEEPVKTVRPFSLLPASGQQRQERDWMVWQDYPI